jgi:hypothetical protein
MKEFPFYVEFINGRVEVISVLADNYNTAIQKLCESLEFPPHHIDML